jgi:hypothetical protein
MHSKEFLKAVGSSSGVEEVVHRANLLVLSTGAGGAAAETEDDDDDDGELIRFLHNDAPHMVWLVETVCTDAWPQHMRLTRVYSANCHENRWIADAVALVAVYNAGYREAGQRGGGSSMDGYGDRCG